MSPILCIKSVSLPQQQKFYGNCSSFRCLNDKLNAERKQIFKKATVPFLSLYIFSFDVNLRDLACATPFLLFLIGLFRA